MKLRIRNWTKFQHYKDRNPPWIKLHFELLSSEDWVVLGDASRVLAVACMLVASRNEGFIRVDSVGAKHLKRVAYLNSDPDFKPLIECGFLESASDMQANASALQADARPETETETETEERGKNGKRFSPPTVEQVAEYVAERRCSVDPQRFVDFYAAKGWYVGKNKMKDWKASVRTWESKDREQRTDPHATSNRV